MNNAPQIWNYHPDTFVLFRTTEPCYADVDPEVPDGWIFPGSSTLQEPGPDVDGKLQMFDLELGHWKYEDVPAGDAETTPSVGDASPEELAQVVRQKRDQLLQTAALRIEPLKDAIDLGIATPEEEATLEQWKQYRVALNRVTLQPSYPETVAWPAVPGEPSME